MTSSPLVDGLRAIGFPDLADRVFVFESRPVPATYPLHLICGDRIQIRRALGDRTYTTELTVTKYMCFESADELESAFVQEKSRWTGYVDKVFDILWQERIEKGTKL